MHSGNREVRQDIEFNVSRGGRPTNSEAMCESVARKWRDMHCDNIARRQLVRSQSNWYQVSNRMLDNI